MSPDFFNTAVNDLILFLNNLKPNYLFICSDDINSKNYVLSKLDMNIKVIEPECDLQPMNYEFRDFFALTLCSEIYMCSKTSTFAICASLIGNINIKKILARDKMLCSHQPGAFLDAKFI